MQTYTSGIGTLFMSMSRVLNPRLVLVLVQKTLFPKHEVGDESEWKVVKRRRRLAFCCLLWHDRQQDCFFFLHVISHWVSLQPPATSPRPPPPNLNRVEIG